jgi:hypothetical protein
MYPLCRIEKEWSHILRREGAKPCRDELLERTVTSKDPEIGIREVVCNKIKYAWPKTGLYFEKCG